MGYAIFKVEKGWFPLHDAIALFLKPEHPSIPHTHQHASSQFTLANSSSLPTCWPTPFSNPVLLTHPILVTFASPLGIVASASPPSILSVSLLLPIYPSCESL